MDKLIKDMAEAIYKLLMVEHSKDSDFVATLKKEKAVKHNV